MQLTYLQRMWTVGDSSAWIRTRDSIRLAMSERNASPHLCEAYDSLLRAPPDTQVPRTSGTHEAFRLCDQDVLIGASPIHTDTSTVWAIDLTSYPRRVPICQRRRRLLTLDEMLGAIHRQLAEQIGF